MSVEQLIASILGTQAEPFRYTVAGEARTGWTVCPGVDPQSGEDLALHLVEASWRRMHADGIQLFAGYAPGGQPGNAQVFALPGAQVLDVVEFCRVAASQADMPSFDDAIEEIEARRGIVDADQREGLDDPLPQQDAVRQIWERAPRGPAPWRIVQERLAEIMRIAPFAIVYATEAHLRAMFTQEVAKDQADLVARIVLETAPDAAESAVSSLEERGLTVPMEADWPDVPAYDAAMPEYIVAVQGFTLWWD